MLRLQHHDIEIVIENVPQYGNAEGDTSRRFEREIQLDLSTGFSTTQNTR